VSAEAPAWAVKVQYEYEYGPPPEGKNVGHDSAADGATDIVGLKDPVRLANGVLLANGLCLCELLRKGLRLAAGLSVASLADIDGRAISGTVAVGGSTSITVPDGSGPKTEQSLHDKLTREESAKILLPLPLRGLDELKQSGPVTVIVTPGRDKCTELEAWKQHLPSEIEGIGLPLI
jgi:hypothetical protein